jgi:hypothetical protein
MTLRFPRRGWLIAVVSVLLNGSAWAQSAFDHGHAAWTGLLKRHVVVLRDGRVSQVRYAGFSADRAALRAYLQTLSSVSESEFSAFGKAQQQAFLINAYNAFTVELILTKYPGIRSIKELGTLFQSPWKIGWVPLLGRKVSLDDIEHRMLRQRGRYDDPRVHFAVNCASVGCPALREEAFVPDRLDAQLEQQARRFLSDRSRNRFDRERERLEVSKIFDWYGEDFRLGHRGIASLRGFLARFADQLADNADHRQRIRSQGVDVVFLDYDWTLNDAPARGMGE